MSIAIETVRNANLTLEIMHDGDPRNPREEFDHVGRMVCGHRRYRLGDSAKTLGWTYRSENFDGWDELKAYLHDEQDAALVLPLALYDHSGITMSIGRGGGWDSGQVGFIYVTNAALAEYWPSSDPAERLEKARKCLEAEVQEYDAYLTGEVYAYTVTDEQGELLSSCGGFYGVETAQEEGQNALEYCVEECANRAAKTDAADAIGAHI